MTTAEILREARALIDTPEKWTKGVEAQDAEGNEVPARDKRAVCWCVTGALEYVTGAEESGIYGRYLAAARAFADANAEPYAFVFNDRESTTHADLMAAFDRAIEAVS